MAIDLLTQILEHYQISKTEYYLTQHYHGAEIIHCAHHYTKYCVWTMNTIIKDNFISKDY